MSITELNLRARRALEAFEMDAVSPSSAKRDIYLEAREQYEEATQRASAQAHIAGDDFRYYLDTLFLARVLITFGRAWMQLNEIDASEVEQIMRIGARARFQLSELDQNCLAALENRQAFQAQKNTRLSHAANMPREMLEFIREALDYDDVLGERVLRDTEKVQELQDKIAELESSQSSKAKP